MATTYTATKAAAGAPARAGIDITSVWSNYALTAALVLNDVIKMVKIPAGATILDVTVGVDALDSSTGIIVAVGDSGDDDRFITGATIGRSALPGTARLNAQTGVNYTYTTETTIDFKVTTAASGTSSPTGNIRVNVIYTMQ